MGGVGQHHHHKAPRGILRPFYLTIVKIERGRNRNDRQRCSPYFVHVLGVEIILQRIQRQRSYSAKWRQFPAFAPCNCPFRRISANLAYCRRACVTTVAAPVFPAEFCGAKFAIRWRFPSFPPHTSATIPPTPPYCVTIFSNPFFRIKNGMPSSILSYFSFSTFHF
jgi:hypothetical protein